VYCWGDNSLGQLGNGADRSAPAPYFGLRLPTPTRVVGAQTFTSITAAYSITCGATTAGVAWCWGGNVDRVLGSAGTQTCRLISYEYYDVPYFSDEPCSTSPQAVLTKTGVSSVVSWQYGACAVLTTSELECWSDRSGPTLVPGASVTKAWLLWFSVCGTEASGAVSCWRSTPPFTAEQPFGQGPTLVDLHTSGRHHCGLERVVGTVYCWGANFDGALGDGTTLHRNLPVPVAASVGARIR
jgi:alpha-tubulin suppressor-like RCC1 family protein